MKISKKIGTSLALMTVGTLLAVACNSSTADSCLSYCERFAACLDAGTGGEVQMACQNGCNQTLDAGGLNACTNASAGFDCLAGLSCPDLTSVATGEPSQAFLNCAAKAGCDGGI